MPLILTDERSRCSEHRSRPCTLHAFQLCTFALSLASINQGDLVAGGRSFERGRAACGAAGLFTEEFDVQQRQLRGNLPQAFVHAIFLGAAAAVGEALADASRTTAGRQLGPR